MENNTTQLKSPVVAVLGHVDHGKTSLLDYLRKSRITSGEAGGITQHIGAYQVEHNGRKITFIDTPGHEAFINLRERGAKTADIALLIIDAVESVKPQTIESIKIIQQAGIPMIVAFNKIDLPNANPKKVTQDLLRYNVITEENGGKIATVAVSAKTGQGISDLLETILLISEMKKITASNAAPFEGVVIESKKDKFRGTVATIIVQNGTVSVGDTVWIEGKQEKIRALFNDLGKAIKQGFPGMPLEVLGFSILPGVGAQVSKEKKEEKVKTQNVGAATTPEAILSIFLKADATGSLEAITDGLPKEVAVVETGIGDITEGDITHAKATRLVIIGFNVKVSSQVQKFAHDEGVRIRTYTIIYKLFEEIKDVVEILKKGPQKDIIGQAKILQVFSTSVGIVAGSQIVEGRVARGDKVEIVRQGKVIQDNLRITSIRLGKEEVTKAEKGKLCGIRFSAHVDFVVGDMIQSYILYEL